LIDSIPVSGVLSRKTRDRVWVAALFIGACELAGFAGAWTGGLTRANPWIDDSEKPALWPPAWLFPVVFAFINYPSLGVATWLVWRNRRNTLISGAMRLFVTQLAYNAVFLPLVYRVKRRDLYVVMDFVGVGLTALSARSYTGVDRRAGLAIAPYFAWICFTTSIKVRWWRLGMSQASRNVR